MTDKQQLFVEHYISCLNATEAAFRAGYGGNRQTLAVTGHENLRNPKIRAAINEALNESAIPPAEILLRLSEHARGDLGDFFDTTKRTTRLDIKAAKAAGLTHLIKRYTRNEKGVSIELYDAQSAMVQLGRFYKMWVDSYEHSGNIDIQFVNNWREEAND